jgi:chloride channel 3/4/5
MTKVDDLATITAVGHTLRTLEDFLASSRYRGFPIIDNQSRKTLLGHVTWSELMYAIRSAKAEPRNMSPDTEVFFSHQPVADPLTTLDLRPWMNQTPITLNGKATLQLTIDMFQKLGLKYILYIEKGSLKGMLTKKDIWYVLNSNEKEGLDGYVSPPRLARRRDRDGVDSSRTSEGG